MKKRTILNLLTSIPLFASFTMSIVVSHSNEVKDSLAVSSENPGIFKMITNLDDLNEEDQVIIAADTFDGHNAISDIDNDEKKLNFHTIEYDVSYLDDEGYLVAAKTYSEIFQVYKDDDGAIALLGTTSGGSLWARYICLDDDYGHIIPQTMDNKGDNCSWYFISQGDGNFIVRNKERLHLYLTYTNDGTYITADIKDKAINFRIFKKIRCEEIVIQTNPKHLSYYKDEEKELDGLELKYVLEDDSSFIVKYEDATQIIYIEWANNSEMCVHAVDGTIGGGYVTFYIPITVIDNPHYVYKKIYASSYKDYRGSYLLVYDKGDGTGYVFDNSLDNLNQSRNYYSVNISNGQIDGVNSFYEQRLVNVSRYTFSSINSYYMSLGDSYRYFSGESDDDIKISVLTTDLNRISFFNDEHSLNISGETPTHFVYNESDDRFMFTNSNEHHEVSLFKLSLTSSISSELDSFKTEFVNHTSLCDPTGKEKKITISDWSTLSDLFNSLSNDAQGYLANITYEHGKETKNSLEDIVDRYDYIISKYSEFNDFMDRKLVNTYENHYSSSMNNPSINSNKDSTIIIIVVASISSITLFSLLLGLKKKKYN